MSDLRVNIAGVELKNPVITASGTFGYAEEYNLHMDVSKLGALTLKALTKAPRLGLSLIHILLCGMIATIGLRTLAEAKLDFSHSRNLIIVSLMLVIGLGLSGGIQFSESFTLSNIFLSALVGIILNAVLPKNI